MKTRVITAVVGIAVLVLVMLTFNTLLFNLIVAAVALIGMHEVYAALGFDKRDWLLYAVQVPYTLLVMLSSYQVARQSVMPVSFALLLFYCIYLVVRNGSVSYQKVSGLVFFSGIILFCFYSLIHLKILLPVSEYSYDATATTPFSSSCWCCASPGAGTPAPILRAAPSAGTNCAPRSAPKRRWKARSAGCWAPCCSGWSSRWPIPSSQTGIGVSMYLIIALLGVVAAVLGIYGDLFASVVKRQCGIKDYGTIFPGHGGILDRFDSVMFIAPFVSMVITAVFYN